MTLFQAPILTDGATHSAQQFRMMVRDLALGSEGITQGDDLKVIPQDTPNGSVLIGDGSGIVRSKVNVFGGSYAVCNVGSATVDIAPTGGAARSDMVVLRVQDPEYEGDLDPATDPVMFFDVVSGVGSTATDPPFGYTAIPLARIDLPVSTSAITAAMIKDIRKIANPRRDREIYTQSPASASTEIGGTTQSFAYFSTAAGWTIAVPSWASQVRIRMDIGGLRYSTGLFFGNWRATFGSSLTLQTVVLDDNQGTGVRRGPAILADTLTIPSAYRGTSQLLRAQAAGGGGNAGKVSVDNSSTLIADVEFIEAPR